MRGDDWLIATPGLADRTRRDHIDNKEVEKRHGITHYCIYTEKYVPQVATV